MKSVALSAGPMEYEDTGGPGPVLVLLGGLGMQGSLWRHVVAELSPDYRCIVPTLPMGGHRAPMNEDADLSPRGIARLENELLEVLDLEDVTLVGNDSGAFLFAAANAPERIARLVITPCEAFENFPPGLPGRNLSLAAKVPGGVTVLAQTLRLPAMRQLPMSYGWMSKRPVPREVMDRWVAPLLEQPGVRRDLVKYLRSAKEGDMMAAAEGLRSFQRTTLVVWATEDRVMRPEHGRRFADLLPDARLVEVDDSFTLMPQDQPGLLARTIREFVVATTTPSESSA